MQMSRVSALALSPIEFGPAREHPSFQGLSAGGQVRTTSHWTVAGCTIWVFRVPCNCRPCLRPTGSQHTSEFEHMPREPHQGCAQACVDTTKMVLFVAINILRVVTGGRDRSEEPHYRDVPMPAAGAVSVPIQSGRKCNPCLAPPRICPSWTQAGRDVSLKQESCCADVHSLDSMIVQCQGPEPETPGHFGNCQFSHLLETGGFGFQTL